MPCERVFKCPVNVSNVRLCYVMYCVSINVGVLMLEYSFGVVWDLLRRTVGPVECNQGAIDLLSARARDSD